MTRTQTPFAHVFTTRTKRKTSVVGRITTLLAIWRERQQLAAMEPHRLSDIGKSERDAHIEAKRPVWDAPSRWLQ